MNRLFLYSGFLFILILIFDAYDRDYNQPKIEIVQSENSGSTSKSAKQPPRGSINNETVTGSVKPTQKNIRSLENRKLIIDFDSE